MTKIYNNIPIFFNNIPKLQFRSNFTSFLPVTLPNEDSFATNPLYDNFATKSEIEAIAKSNPRICQLMKEYNLQPKANMDELEALKKEHLNNTRVMAVKIYSNLPKEYKEEVNLKYLQEAALLHDYGKVLIPKSVLNKKTDLSPYERKIIELHSELGYELLRQSKLSDRTKNLIKYHHHDGSENGYPQIDTNFDVRSIDAQILRTADKFTALCEDRCYKDAFSKEEALNIIYDDVRSGHLSNEVYSALQACL